MIKKLKENFLILLISNMLTIIMVVGGGCVISLWRTLFYVIYCIILEVS